MCCKGSLAHPSWFFVGTVMALVSMGSSAQELIFEDGFETGDTSRWSVTVGLGPDPGSTCATAADVTSASFPYQLTGTFTDDPTGGTCDTMATNAVWFRYTPVATGDATVTLTNNTLTTSFSRLAIFTGASCDPYGAQVACVTSTSQTVSTTATLYSGTDYLIVFYTDGESYTMVDPEIDIVGP